MRSTLTTRAGARRGGERTTWPRHARGAPALRRVLAVLAVLTPVFLLGAPAASAADLEDQTALAERYSPVVSLVDQPEPCGPGEPYQPTDVSAILGRDDVALRGPWTSDDLIKAAPTAEDLEPGLLGYHLDLPGDPLRPGCSYEKWADVATGGTQPVVYAHVVSEEGAAGRLALQYWIYYPFNDYNNKHESDWEMLQVEFAADDAAGALETDPVRLAYSQHEGAELAAWDDPKLEVVDGTHPVVRPAAGSHANYYADALYLGRSASQGFGCDDARSPATDVRPAVEVVPSDGQAARSEYPWLGFEGHWGQREEAFYNGPTGPNTKTQWEQPFTWSDEEGRTGSYAVPASSLFGTAATDLFCNGIAVGSDAFRILAAEPLVFLAVLAAVVLTVWGLARLTDWRPSTPLRLVRRRSIGQVVSASLRMYASRPWLFSSLGLVALPFAALTTWATQVGETVSSDEDSTVGFGLSVVAIGGGVGGLLVVALVQGAAMHAVAALDAGRDVTPWRAFRSTLHRLAPTLGAGSLVLLTMIVLAWTIVLLPVGLVLAVLWALWLPAVQLDRCGPVRALARSARLVRRRFVPVIVLIGFANLVASAVGPVLGFGVLLANVPFDVGNAVAGLTSTVLAPFVGVVATYVYADCFVRAEQREPGTREELPAEGELGSAPPRRPLRPAAEVGEPPTTS